MRTRRFVVGLLVVALGAAAPFPFASAQSQPLPELEMKGRTRKILGLFVLGLTADWDLE